MVLACALAHELLHAPGRFFWRVERVEWPAVVRLRATPHENARSNAGVSVPQSSSEYLIGARHSPEQLVAVPMTKPVKYACHSGWGLRHRAPCSQLGSRARTLQ
eukprot:4134738-Pleurochrysis_carterae.AAC.1